MLYCFEKILSHRCIVESFTIARLQSRALSLSLDFTVSSARERLHIFDRSAKNAFECCRVCRNARYIRPIKFINVRARPTDYIDIVIVNSHFSYCVSHALLITY
uniref:Uncharacterized protein n=1 Tax=Trichogramma kaykai TaxID=54128 RepID=A0ABD2XAG6_9HYME